MKEALVIIPTYNERDNIALMIEAVFKLPEPFDLLIIDDGSPDGTAAIVKSLMLQHPNRLFLEERKGKLGLGTAYIHGFRWALNREYAYIFEMDCDFSHDPMDLLRLYDTCKNGGYDMSVGSRYIKGGKVKDWPLSRVLLSYFASVYVNLILWMGIHDTTAGFCCYRRSALEGISLDAIRFVGYAFQIEMKYTVKKSGFKIKEVPIIFKDREKGTSKMSSKIFKEAFFGVFQIRKKFL